MENLINDDYDLTMRLIMNPIMNLMMNLTVGLMITFLGVKNVFQ